MEPYDTLMLEMSAIAGGSLTEGEAATFAMMSEYINGKDGVSWLELKNKDKRKEKFVTTFVNATSCVSKGYRAAAIHSDYILNLEKQLDLLIQREWPESHHGVVSIGNTVRFDTHYHSFLFSYRACLDYLAKGVAAGFSANCRSYNNFSNVNKDKPSLMLDEIKKIMESYREDFKFVLSEGNEYSFRDRAAHMEFLKPVHIAGTRLGLRLYSGVEQMEMLSDKGMQLSDLLGSRMNVLHAFIKEIYVVLTNNEWPYPCESKGRGIL